MNFRMGLATAPVLFARDEYPIIEEFIKRDFSGDGDVEEALRLVKECKADEKVKLKIFPATRHFHCLRSPTIAERCFSTRLQEEGSGCAKLFVRFR